MMMFTVKHYQVTLKWLLLSVGCLLLASNAVLAQETRGSILGTVVDPTDSVLPGATVMITNTETNISTEVTTNESGYFEIPYLLPATYDIAVTAAGFKRHLQQGFVLTVGNRAEITIRLTIGDVTEAVSVEATGGLLETTTGSSSATLDKRQIMDLPVFGNSALLLVRNVPGMQWTGQPNYLGLHSNIGASSVSAAGGVGGNEFSIDGVPNAGPARRAGFLPYTDTIAEVRVESASFDASKGHTSGATISLLSKSGTNDYHGTLTWQHWQQRFNGTPTSTNAAYWGQINDAEARGNSAEAQRLRGLERQDTGRSNNWAAVLGGPVRVPWLFNGRDKLFFFFSYNGFKDTKNEEATRINRTVPSEAHRRGDFSDLLRLDPVRYQIYDPRTARLVNGRVVRDPFPNNQVPILNPLYKAYEALYPRPNNVPGVVSAEGINNYLATGTPFNWDYKAFNNRIDFQPSSDHRMFARWNYSDFIEDRVDWTYETARGLSSDWRIRKTVGVTFDHVYTHNSSTIFNWSVAWNRFTDGPIASEFQQSFTPSSVGLPGYLDEKAGDFTHLPSLDFGGNGYSEFTRGFPTPARYSVGTIRGEMLKYFGTHSLRIGADLRNHWRSSDVRGQSSSTFTYNNEFVRQADNTTNAGVIGLEWAAFMLGVPSTVSIDTNDSYYLSSKFGGFYIQDDWKISRKLALNLGLRYELEAGGKERFNRGLAGFDSDATLPITAAAQAAYAANPLPELPASQFIVRGGSLYLGQDGAPDTLNAYKGSWMPRFGFAYQLNDKTVLRGGYGLFYDTNNIINNTNSVIGNSIDQFGFSRNTGTPTTNNNGLTFTGTNLTSPECRANISNCRTILADPFPVRADGTRFNTPLGSALGLMGRVGRGFGFNPYDWERARQQRWRLGIQREMRGNTVVEVAYLGSYSDDIPVERRLDALPEQYWSSGLIRNNANANFLNQNFTNPFNIRNFAFLQTQNPTLYADMSANGFFTGTTRQRNALLRPFPHINNLQNARSTDGESRYHHLEASIQKRMTKGLQYSVAYTWASNLERILFDNEFDEKPTWLPSQNSSPHHLMVSWIYELPVGKGKRFFAENKWAGAVLGGWQMSGIYHLQSGRVFNLGNWFYYGNDFKELELKGDAQSTEDWFNWRVFPGASRDFSASNRVAYEARIRQVVPESVLQQMGNICGPQSNQACTFSNVTPTNFQPSAFHRRVFPQRLNILRSDRMSQVDLNIIRRFGLTEETNLEFRMDVINAFNTVQWDLPNTDINSTNFGRLTTQWNSPRWFQFQLRYTF